MAFTLFAVISIIIFIIIIMEPKCGRVAYLSRAAVDAHNHELQRAVALKQLPNVLLARVVSKVADKQAPSDASSSSLVVVAMLVTVVVVFVRSVTVSRAMRCVFAMRELWLVVSASLLSSVSLASAAVMPVRKRRAATMVVGWFASACWMVRNGGCFMTGTMVVIAF